MADTVAQLVSDVQTEGGFDVDGPTALRWLSRRHRVMVAESRCYRKTVSTTTVSGQRDYTLDPDVVEIEELSVAGIPFGNARHVDLAQGARGYVLLSGDGGVVSPEESVSGAAEFALYPTPISSGDTILLRGAFLPPDLVSGDESTLKVPQDFTDALVSGAIASGLMRIDNRPDLASSHEEIFSAAVDRLRRRVARRYRGTGGAQIRIVGVSA